MDVRETSIRRLVVFHYHLLPGGVTGVIRNGLRAILDLLPEFESVTIAAGRGAGEFGARLREQLPPERASSLSVVPFPVIDYLSENGEDVTADELCGELLSRFGGDDTLFWVHNYQLGKNPVFTEALLAIAYRHPRQRLLLQIHDFPESARYANLTTLSRYVHLPLYPTGRNVRYALLSTYDRSALVHAGVPEQHAVVLPNPVDPDTGSLPDRAKSSRTIRSRFATVPGFLPDKPIILYPVRCIRRKNVLEAALLSRLLPGRANVVVTLPGVSDQERAYAELVERTYRHGLVNGVFAAGTRDGVSFPELVASADLIVSSSVQEGFGYLFIDAVRWGIPLLGRTLPILDDFSALFDPRATLFYDEIFVPALPGVRARILERYYRKLSSITRIHPSLDPTELEASLEAKIAVDRIEFSYLDPLTQAEYLEHLDDTAFLRDTILMNSALVDGVERLLAETPTATTHTDGARSIDAAFGPRTFTHSLALILGGYDTPAERLPGLTIEHAPAHGDHGGGWAADAPLPGESPPRTYDPIRERLVHAFARPENLRLLHEPF